MIRVVDDNGVLIEPVSFEALDSFPDGSVHIFNRAPVLCVSFPHLWNVRVIRSKNHFGRILRFLTKTPESPGFMTVPDIEYGKEWLVILALFPSVSVILLNSSRIPWRGFLPLGARKL